MPNCSNAYSISTSKPLSDGWTFEVNAQIARADETAAFDFLLPVAKWKGYGGTTDYLGTSLETLTWAARCSLRPIVSRCSPRYTCQLSIH
jgi:hypothetical protein